jgi:putative ABC transport system permease protein
VKLGNLLRLYRVRLRARRLQECFAVAGIAAGVALLFASQVASESLGSSVAQLNRGVVGAATLQLSARGAQGFPEAVLEQVRHMPGVRRAAPLLEASANAVGPRASQSVELVGADESLAALGGELVAKARFTPVAGIEAVLLPAPVARRIGVTRFGREMTLQVAGRAGRAALFAQLHASQIGPLVESPIVVAPLEYVRQLTGFGLTRVLIEPAPGRTAAVRAQLERRFGASLNVQPADFEQRLFDVAAAATNQSTALFALISALVGFMFAFNAVLLSVPQRRRLIAGLRREGYAPAAVIVVLVFDALVLGALACAVGLLLGDELSIHLFHATPGYLTSAFAVGSQRVVNFASVAIAAAGGMLASLAAVLSPLRDILSRNPLAAVAPPGKASGDGRRAKLLSALGTGCMLLAVLVLTLAPKLAVAGTVALILALLLLLALPLRLALTALAHLARRLTRAFPHLAAMELRSGGARTVAIAATGAVAVFGNVAIEGARSDLTAGLDNAARDMNAFTDLWVAPAGSSNLLEVQPFAPGDLARRLRRLPGVRAVRAYRGGLLDYGERRVWVIAPPRAASPLVPPSQLLEGSLARARAELRRGGWAVVSQALAREHHLRVGRTFLLPAPHPTRLRVAAISTNVGWAPGAIVMSADAYARAWGSDDVAAFNVLLGRDRPPAAARRAIAGLLGEQPATAGLAVQTAAAHEARERSLTRQGLARLTQIATLILVAAILAMAGIAGAVLWQRRPRLAKLKLEGFAARELWATTLLESLLMLAAGCASGALFGLLGQQLLDRALAEVVNYPVVSSVALLPALASLALVVAVATLVLAVPGWFAMRVPAALALHEPGG